MDDCSRLSKVYSFSEWSFRLFSQHELHCICQLRIWDNNLTNISFYFKRAMNRIKYSRPQAQRYEQSKIISLNKKNQWLWFSVKKRGRKAPVTIANKWRGRSFPPRSPAPLTDTDFSRSVAWLGTGVYEFVPDTDACGTWCDISGRTWTAATYRKVPPLKRRTSPLVRSDGATPSLPWKHHRKFKIKSQINSDLF